MTTNDLGIACCDYANLHNNTGSAVDRIRTILSRYSAVWQTGSAFQVTGPSIPQKAVEPSGSDLEPGQSTLLRYDALFQETTVGPWTAVRRVAALPLFARLNYNKQLSTTSISLNIDATHNRLSHMLGTLDIAANMLIHLCKTVPDDKVLPTPPEAAAVMFYALIHDAFHGPLGHSLDRIADLVLRSKHPNRIDKYFLAAQIEQAKSKQGDLWHALHLVAVWSCEENPSHWSLRCQHVHAGQWNKDKFASEMIEFLACLIDEALLAQRFPQKFWLREIIDGELDADRFDYLLRDTYELRQTSKLEEATVRQLINNARVLSAEIEVPIEKNRVIAKNVDAYRICWDTSTKSRINELLATRANLYLAVYESPEKRVFDEMITHALVWLLRDAISSDPAARPELDATLSELLRSLARITDDELFHFLYEIGAGVSEIQRLAISLVHDVVTGRPFREVWRYGIERKHLESAEQRMHSIAAEWARIEREMSAAAAKSRGDIVALNLHQELSFSLIFEEHQRGRNVTSQQDWDGLVYFMEVLHGRTFQAREQLELILWKRLLNGGVIQSCRRKSQMI